MNLRRVVIVAAAAVAVAGCSSVVGGHGVAVPRRPSTSAGGGFPATSPPPTSAPPSSAPADAQPGAIESPDGDFSVVLPDGWADGTDRMSGLALTGYFGPTANGFATNVNVTRQATGGGTLDQVTRATISTLRSAVHATHLTQPTPRTIDGEPALEYSFTDKQFGRTLRQRQTIVLHAGNGYVITYTALPTSYAASLADADAINDSWRWG